MRREIHAQARKQVIAESQKEGEKKGNKLDEGPFLESLGAILSYREEVVRDT